jgi:hypothetical protein
MCLIYTVVSRLFRRKLSRQKFKSALALSICLLSTLKALNLDLKCVGFTTTPSQVDVFKLHANKLLMLYTISLYLTPGDFTRQGEKSVAQWDNVEYESEILV